MRSLACPSGGPHEPHVWTPLITWFSCPGRKMTDGEIRSEAVRIVDERRGHTVEFSNQPGVHLLEYDEEERRLLAERDGA